MTRREDNSVRKLMASKSVEMSWYKRTGMVIVGLSASKTGIKGRKSAEQFAQRLTATEGFPEWKVEHVERNRQHKDLCLVYGVAL